MSIFKKKFITAINILTISMILSCQETELSSRDENKTRYSLFFLKGISQHEVMLGDDINHPKRKDLNAAIAFVLSDIHAGKDKEVLIHVSVYKNSCRELSDSEPIFTKTNRWSFWISAESDKYKLLTYDKSISSRYLSKEEIYNWFDTNLANLLAGNEFICP
jgi:hypothetical protein